MKDFRFMPNMVFLKIICPCLKRTKNNDSFKSFFKTFLEFLKKKEKTVILKTLKITGNSNGRLIVNGYSFFEAVQIREIDHRILQPLLKRFETNAAADRNLAHPGNSRNIYQLMTV